MIDLRPLKPFARLMALLALCVAVAGCDKCGNRVKLNAPSLPGTCGANAEPLR